MVITNNSCYCMAELVPNEKENSNQGYIHLGGDRFTFITCKCLAQEHNKIIKQGLEIKQHHPELHALTIMPPISSIAHPSVPSLPSQIQCKDWPAKPPLRPSRKRRPYC